ncbi:hypothetical protein D3C72_1296230 [compost metagenome]
MDIAGGVALGEIPAIVGAGQRRLDRPHLLRRHGTPLQPALCQQRGDAAGMLEAGLVAVDMENAFFLQIEIDAFLRRPGEQVFTGRDGEPRGLDGVAAVVGDGGDEFGEPRQLVPARAGIDQQRGVAAQHPLEALDDGGPVGPDLGVGGGQLAAVGERGFHGGIAMPFEQRNGESAPGERVGSGDTGDATADDGDCLHDLAVQKRRDWSPHATCVADAPSVPDLRDSRLSPVVPGGTGGGGRLLLRYAG